MTVRRLCQRCLCLWVTGATARVSVSTCSPMFYLMSDYPLSQQHKNREGRIEQFRTNARLERLLSLWLHSFFSCFWFFFSWFCEVWWFYGDIFAQKLFNKKSIWATDAISNLTISLTPPFFFTMGNTLVVLMHNYPESLLNRSDCAVSLCQCFDKRCVVLTCICVCAPARQGLGMWVCVWIKHFRGLKDHYREL